MLADDGLSLTPPCFPEPPFFSPVQPNRCAVYFPETSFTIPRRKKEDLNYDEGLRENRMSELLTDGDKVGASRAASAFVLTAFVLGDLVDHVVSLWPVLRHRVGNTKPAILKGKHEWNRLENQA